MSEPVDVAVVADKKRADLICERLKANGLRHIDYWPEDMTSGIWYVPQGPFHIRVRELDADLARQIIAAEGLAGEEAAPA
jgi:hypothetical protein